MKSTRKIDITLSKKSAVIIKTKIRFKADLVALDPLFTPLTVYGEIRLNRYFYFFNKS